MQNILNFKLKYSIIIKNIVNGYSYETLRASGQGRPRQNHNAQTALYKNSKNLRQPRLGNIGGSEEEVKYALSVFKGKFTSGKACHTGFCTVLSKGATPAVVDGVKRSEKIQKACLEDCAGYPDFDKLIDKLNDWQAEELLQKVQAVVAP